MSTRTLTTNLSLTLLLVASYGFAQPQAPRQASIDAAAFLEVAGEAMTEREGRLLSIEDFLVLSQRPEAVLLDTRSAAAFEQMHLAGAVHLNFSDLTSESLQRVIGDPDRPIYIYCNNNFTNDEQPFPTKLPPAALNLPTFATLWAYGYRNLFELGDLLELEDARLRFEGSAVP